MKQDFLTAASGSMPTKRLSKETLNHPGLIRMVSGLDPWQDAPDAFCATYERIGVDLVNRVPLSPAPAPSQRPTLRGDGYWYSPLGVYDTASRHQYPFREAEELFAIGDVKLDYATLVVPPPHPLEVSDARRRQIKLGNVGMYYPMLYTTLFMWGVEWLGWEVFMVAVMEDEEAFDRIFLAPAFEQTQALVDQILPYEASIVVLHDDLADARGPVFPPDFYKTYIFPRYRTLFSRIHQAGKEVLFVADGNMDAFLEPLRDAGADGIMAETPSTSMDHLLDVFDGCWIAGGMDTRMLTFGTPVEIAVAVDAIGKRTQNQPRFMLSSPGGLHANIPIENLVAYLDARVTHGFTNPGWRG